MQCGEILRPDHDSLLVAGRAGAPGKIMAKLEAGAHEAETALLQYLERAGPSMLDDLARHLPRYTWNQVFAAVDRLSRRGRLQIRQRRRFEYVASLADTDPVSSRSGEPYPPRDGETAAAAQGEEQ